MFCVSGLVVLLLRLVGYWMCREDLFGSVLSWIGWFNLLWVW